MHKKYCTSTSYKGAECESVEKENRWNKKGQKERKERGIGNKVRQIEDEDVGEEEDE